MAHAAKTPIMATFADRIFGIDGNDDDGANPRRDPEPEPTRLPGWEPEPEPEPELPPVSPRELLRALSKDLHEAVVAPAKLALDKTTDVLKTEGVLKGPSSKLEAARRLQKEREMLHAEELAAKNLMEIQRERERVEKAEKLRESAAALDRKLAETLLSSDDHSDGVSDDDEEKGEGEEKQEEDAALQSDDSDSDSSTSAPPAPDRRAAAARRGRPKSFIARFAAPKVKLQDSSHVPASHFDETGQHVGMTDGHHPHRAQKTLRERQHTDHVAALLEAAEDAAPPKLATLIRKMRPAVSVLLDAMDVVSAWAARTGFWLYFAQAQEIWAKLPTTAAHALYGLALCFFGGIFANTLAACVIALAALPIVAAAPHRIACGLL